MPTQLIGRSGQWSSWVVAIATVVFPAASALGGQIIGLGAQHFTDAINADGSIVAGHAPINGPDSGFRWTAAGGIQNLGTSDPSDNLVVTDISDDGSVIVGHHNSSGQAFRWTATGGLVDVPPAAGSAAFPTVVSGDGKVMGGYWSTGGGSQFRWTAATGYQTLNPGN